MTTAEPVQIRVSISGQILQLYRGGRAVAEWMVSTGKAGPGEMQDSGCTPRGRHHVRIGVGAGCEPGTVFVSRRPTGEIYSEQLAAQHPHRDWILTRILWLTGDEPGRNRGGVVDTMRRYIYIHGTPDSEPMCVPASHGCIRMRNADLVELFDQVRAGTPVLIED